MKSSKYFVITLVLSVVLAGCRQNRHLLPAEEITVNTLISQMPAGSSQERDQLAAQLIGMNPEAAMFLAAKLNPPADPTDNAARYALSAMTHYAARHGAESERSGYAQALIEALEMVSDPHNKAFLISQLQLVGKSESVKPLAGYLQDDFLCEYAAGALLTIGADSVEPVFLRAFAGANPTTRPVLIKGLGQLQSSAAERKIRVHAESDDPATRQAALYALANIGDPASAAVLENACKTGNAYEQAQNASLYLRYAQRLAENGHLELCEGICSELIVNPETAPHLRAAAKSVHKRPAVWPPVMRIFRLLRGLSLFLPAAI
jgi:hypothetical protein